MRRFAVALAVLFATADAESASAQGPEPDRPPDWAGDAAFAVGNAALGGLSAGVARALDGGRFWPGFRDGAIGGLVAYGGRRIAAERFTGAGLLGRSVGAVGASVTRNAVEGGGVLGRVALPLGPIWIHLRSDAGSLAPTPLRIRTDVPTLLATAYFALRSDTRLDWEATLASGTPVFTSMVRWADGYWQGTQAAGVIWLRGNSSDPFPDVDRAGALAHERIHVLQYDFGVLLVSEPAEAGLASRVPAGPWLHSHFHFGLHLAPWGLMNLLLPYERRPWEHEAWFLSGVRPGG